jgi:HEPN domain-containing protein
MLKNKVLHMRKIGKGIKKSKRRSSKINLGNKRFYAFFSHQAAEKALGSALSCRLYLLCK